MPRSAVSRGLTATFGTPSTALTVASLVGDTALAVTAGTGTNFTVGKIVLVDTGTGAELAQVTAVAANTVTVTALQKAHAIAATVLTATFTVAGLSPLWPSFT